MRRGENFPLLDGLRGVAALAVVLRHGRQFLLGSTDHSSNYLAVDFFFMLSGFVVCAAYGRRLDAGLSWRRFMTIRLIRLWPMLLIGGLLGGASLAFSQAVLSSKLVPWNGMVEGVCDALLIPLGAVTRRPLFAGNFPIWSLFFEIIINALYGFRFGFSKRTWILVMLFWSIVLIFLVHRFDSIDPIGYMGPVGFLGGVPRALVPFGIGVMIYLGNFHRICPRVSSWLLAAILVATLYFHSEPAWIFDLIATLLIFPLLVTASAASPMGKVATRLAFLAGELSYPVYLMHEPVLRTMMVVEKMTATVIPYPLNITLALAIILPVSWLVLRLLDKPIRRALDHLLLKDKEQRGVLVEPAL